VAEGAWRVRATGITHPSNGNSRSIYRYNFQINSGILSVEGRKK
jgi:hypothetical protein